MVYLSAWAQGTGEPQIVARARSAALADFVKNAARPQQPRPLEVGRVSRNPVRVVVAAQNVANEPLRRSHLTTADIPGDHVTDSLVPASALERIEGALLVGHLRKGDVLMWQLLDDAAHPRSVLACMHAVREAVRRARRGGPPPPSPELPNEAYRGKSIVLATRDIAAGEQITFDKVTHTVDRIELTASAVRAENVSYIINQKTFLPILKGDVLRWTSFEVPNDKATVKGCQDALVPVGTAREGVAAARDTVYRR